MKLDLQLPFRPSMTDKCRGVFPVESKNNWEEYKQNAKQNRKGKHYEERSDESRAIINVSLSKQSPNR